MQKPPDDGYYYREELGDYSYEIGFKTLDELNAWVAGHCRKQA